MTTAAEQQTAQPAPAAAAAPAPVAATRERRIRPQQFTAEGALALGWSALGALGLVWVLHQRVLPFSGALGFVVCWYVAFLAMYAGVTAMREGRHGVTDRLARVAFSSGGVLVVGTLVLIIVDVGVHGSSVARRLGFFTQTMVHTGPLDPIESGGVLHAMVGSLEQLGIATALSVPLGIVAAVFMAEIGGRFARPVRMIVDAMSALPSIVAGLFILAGAILILGMDKSGLAAGLAITVMMLPIVTRAAEVVFRLVPGGLREASYALGATQWRTTWRVVLPTARSGLATAMVMAMARGVGETSPVLLTAGFTHELNLNALHGPQVSLPLYIYNYVRFPQPVMVTRAYGAALALMLVVLILFVTARVLGGQGPGQLTRRQRRRLAREAGGA